MKNKYVTEENKDEVVVKKWNVKKYGRPPKKFWKVLGYDDKNQTMLEGKVTQDDIDWARKAIKYI